MPAPAAENGGVPETVPFDLVERHAVLREDRGICGGIILSSHTATA